MIDLMLLIVLLLFALSHPLLPFLFEFSTLHLSVFYRDYGRSSSYLLPLLLCLTFQMFVWASSYSDGLSYGLFLICGILAFSVCMSYFVISTRTVSLLMSWEGLTLISALLVACVHSDLSLASFYKVICYNALPGIFALFLFTQGSYSMHSMSLWVGAIWVKSAIWFLHGWLIEAMSSPILVSSLLHSATLVIAGCVLCSKLGMYTSFPFFLFLCVVSAGWMMFTIFAVGSDLKWTLAFSTTAHISIMVFLSGGSSSAGGDVLFEGGYRVLHGLVKFEIFLFCGTMLASSVWMRGGMGLSIASACNSVMAAILHTVVVVSQMALHSSKVEWGGWARSELPLGSLEWSLQLLLSMSYTIYASVYQSKDERWVWGSGILCILYYH